MALAVPGGQQVEIAGETEGPLLYRCTQGSIFVKKPSDPRSGKILKLSKPVGGLVPSTGKVWTGPSGGQWAELSPSEGYSWALVKGPGFGLTGPALIDAADDEIVHIKVHLLDEDERKGGICWESLIPKELRVRDVKGLLEAATGLEAKFCCLSKDMPAMSSRGIRLGADYMPELADERVLADCKLGSEATFMLVYVGDYPKDLKVRPSLPPEPSASQSEIKAGLVK